jgi:hypothetical protein
MIIVMLMISSNQQIWNSIIVLIQTLKLDVPIDQFAGIWVL